MTLAFPARGSAPSSLSSVTASDSTSSVIFAVSALAALTSALDVSGLDVNGAAMSAWGTTTAYITPDSAVTSATSRQMMTRSGLLALRGARCFFFPPMFLPSRAPCAQSSNLPWPHATGAQDAKVKDDLKCAA